MIYLRKFENYAAYEAAKSNLILPNVSLITENNKVEYNPNSPVPPTPTETIVECKYDVYDTEYETFLCNNTTYFSAMEIDGVEQPSVISAYTFSTTGEHTVKYTLTDPTSIGEYAFYDCSSLTSIDIPDSVTSIGNRALSDNSLISVTVGSGVTSITSPFFNNSDLESMTINATTPPTLNGYLSQGEMSDPTIYVPSGSVDAYKAANEWMYYDIQAIS